MKTREVAVKAGAAIFTKDFSDKSAELNKAAQKWLWATGFIASVTLAVAVAFYLAIPSGVSDFEAIQRIAAKLAILGILITGMVWCGRNYKALMHQASVYQFKALGLQTFQAFSAGAAESQTKDAVLLETTRSIFSQHQSGYIDEGSSGGTQVIEVLRGAIDSGSK